MSKIADMELPPLETVAAIIQCHRDSLGLEQIDQNLEAYACTLARLHQQKFTQHGAIGQLSDVPYDFLHRIWSWCIADNVGSARVVEKLGMRREGHLRENEFFKGRWWDTLMFGILEQEWQDQQQQ